ncbi:nucleolar protein dao-5-like [Littorina saxatilis]|uniref:nucleolar protein dao-5-like n=1 Tax=Littorina saxatilis TaxID=31220 RepID=UPI0038B43D41
METDQHSHETEFKIEIDVAEEPPLAWCMTQQQPQSVDRSQTRQTVSGCDRMEEEERTVKIEVETEIDTQEPPLVRLPVSQCMTEQHSQEPEVKIEVKTERDTQEQPQSVPQCTAEQHSQEQGIKTEVKIEIDVAEEPPLAWCMTQQHLHVRTGRGRPRRPNQGKRPARLQEELPVSGARAKRQRRTATTGATAQVPSSNRDSQGAWFDGAHDATRQEPEPRQQQGLHVLPGKKPPPAPSPIAPEYSESASDQPLARVSQKRASSSHKPQASASKNTASSLDQTQAPASENRASSSDKEKKCSKPQRPCLFCGVLQTHIVRHLKRKHCDEDAVSSALKLKTKQDQHEAFEKIRKLGILHANQIAASSGGDLYHRERRQGTDRTIVMCSTCNGFYSEKNIWKHKKRCTYLCTTPSGYVSFPHVHTSPGAPASKNTTSSSDKSQATGSKNTTSSSDKSQAPASKHTPSSSDKSQAPASKHTPSSSDKSQATGSKNTSSSDKSQTPASKHTPSSSDKSQATGSKNTSSSDKSQTPASKHTPSSLDQTQATGSKNRASSSDKEKKMSKPQRPCLFCGILQTHMVRHLKRKHCDEDAVSSALKLKTKQDQHEAFEKIRKLGILHANQIAASSGGDLYHRERRQGTDRTIVMCSTCNGFYSKKNIRNHKKRCTYLCTTPSGYVSFPHVHTSPGAPASKNTPSSSDKSQTLASKNTSSSDKSQAPALKNTSSSDKSQAPASKNTTSSSDKSQAPASKNTTSSSDKSQAPASKNTTSSSDKSQATGSKNTPSSSDKSQAPASKNTTSSSDKSQATGSKNTSSSDKSQTPASKNTTSSLDQTQAPASKNRASSSDKEKKMSKPQRPCLFCGVLQTHMVRHLKRKHCDEDAVSSALKLKTKQDQHEAFEKIRKLGILHANQIAASSGGDLYHRERRHGTDQPTMVMCSTCNGFYVKKGIWKHKKRCTYLCTTPSGYVSFPQGGDYARESGVTEQFRTEIVDRFRQDEVGNVCRTDRVILLLGQKLYNKSVKKDRRVIKSEMRRLGNLVLEMRKVSFSETLGGADVINRENFVHLTSAIQNLTTSPGNVTKAGLKFTIGYLLKKVAKVMKEKYIVEEKSLEKAVEVDRFLCDLDLKWDFIF